jgi:hypothetical protein
MWGSFQLGAIQWAGSLVNFTGHAAASQPAQITAAEAIRRRVTNRIIHETITPKPALAFAFTGAGAGELIQSLQGADGVGHVRLSIAQKETVQPAPIPSCVGDIGTTQAPQTCASVVRVVPPAVRGAYCSVQPLQDIGGVGAVIPLAITVVGASIQPVQLVIAAGEWSEEDDTDAIAALLVMLEAA